MHRLLGCTAGRCTKTHKTKLMCKERVRWQTIHFPKVDGVGDKGAQTAITVELTQHENFSFSKKAKLQLVSQKERRLRGEVTFAKFWHINLVISSRNVLSYM